MAKNRNKKKNAGAAPMDTGAEPVTMSNLPEEMDTSEVGGSTIPSSSVHRKVKGVQMKRTKNMRKKKAMAKAISRFEKISEGVSKKETKKSRVKLAKTLYD
ncbi:hypothetical protein V2J09_007387 [Rumex salicifolius]